VTELLRRTTQAVRGAMSPQGFNLGMNLGRVAGAGIDQHCHFHVVPIRGLHDLDFGNQDPNPDPAMMDRAAITIREELRRLGFSEFVADD